MSYLEHIVGAVHAVREAKKRIDFPIRYGTTFFSYLDFWMWQAELDTKVCPICLQHEKTEVFIGNHLRVKFPYLLILDENTIEPRAHPNCRCLLVRFVGPLS